MYQRQAFLILSPGYNDIFNTIDHVLDCYDANLRSSNSYASLLATSPVPEYPPWPVGEVAGCASSVAAFVTALYGFSATAGTRKRVALLVNEATRRS